MAQIGRGDDLVRFRHGGSRERGLRRGSLGPPVRTFLALLLPLVQTLQRFIDANRQEFDYLILHAQTPLEFLHGLRLGCKLHQHVVAFAMLLNPVSQPALAPLLDFVDGTARRRDILAHGLDEVVDLFFCRIGFHDEQILVDSHSSSVVEPWARRLNFAMDFSTPSAIMDSAASAAWSTSASSSSVCRRVKRDSR